MDGIEGGVPASGSSGWQGGEVFSEVQRWNRIEADGQMKTPWEFAEGLDDEEDGLVQLCALDIMSEWHNVGSMS